MPRDSRPKADVLSIFFGFRRVLTYRERSHLSEFRRRHQKWLALPEEEQSKHRMEACLEDGEIVRIVS